MAVMPGVRWRPLPSNATQRPMRATQVILHTAVDAPGPTDLWRYFARADVSFEAHFWVPLNGATEQHIDSDRSADANYRANRRPDGTGALSVETEDEGRPHELPWNPQQMRALADILVWAHRTHGIPLETCPSPTAPGVGWHAMWGAPSEWTPVRGKTCPGPARAAQVPAVIALARSLINPTPPPPAVPVVEQEDDDTMIVIRSGKGIAHITPTGPVILNVNQLVALRKAYVAAGRAIPEMTLDSDSLWQQYVG